MSDIDLPPVGQRLGQGDLDRLVQRFQRASQWQATTASMAGQGRGRQVIAVVDARGVLQSLDIPDVACRGDGEELAREVVEAVTAARTDVAEQLTRAGRLAFGDDAPEVATIASAAAARSRAPIAAERGPDRTADGADDTDRRSAPPEAHRSTGQW